MNMDGKYLIGISGVISLAAIEITALFMGIDGVILATIIGAISAMVAGICGFTLGVTKKEEK